ncbi:nucleotide-binding universal stress UspA family protein [Paucimonas lemoignei]|uniref:Nucleotide-binding universal stress UspA family protein n=1 Tax=Paucimonas lemoignei TaxID=29443 RepID=A0A4R3I283_PAULE|nr:universal stress protein [Paucimonas lemoignei]TCS39324.1 nucleotide-binding universal stress UspA family protein [Paucimonas lemoignei]
MSFKTILVHVDESRHIDKRIDMAIKLARENQAHLIGMATTGVSQYLYETMALSPGDTNLVPYLEIFRKRAEKALEHFKSAVQRAGNLSFETRLADDEPSGGISLFGRYADLVVLSQFDADEASPANQPYMPEYIAMNGGSPVLLVPHSSMVSSFGERVLIAWNGSPEAKRAVHYALPILQRAKEVVVVSYLPSGQEEAFGERPASELAAYLMHHNIQARNIQEENISDVGDALLSLAANLSSDLLVMGCYGHTRIREILLGGATRKIFQSTTIPVLLSH